MSQSPAEKARETKLREDPLAIVLSPTHVECKRCGKRIKLSAKSAFDPLHWRTHRARCLKTRHTKTKTTRNTEIKTQAVGITPTLAIASHCEPTFTCSPPYSPCRRRPPAHGLQFTAIVSIQTEALNPPHPRYHLLHLRFLHSINPTL